MHKKYYEYFISSSKFSSVAVVVVVAGVAPVPMIQPSYRTELCVTKMLKRYVKGRARRKKFLNTSLSHFS